MARLWSCGFEVGSITSEMGGLAAPLVIETTTKRSGDYSGKLTALTSGARKGMLHDFAAASGNGPYYFRAYVYFVTLPTAENTFFDVWNATTASMARITVDSSGALRLYDEDGVIGSASSALSTGTWYRIEMLIDGTPAAGSDVVRAYIDGVEFAGSATRSLSAGVRTFRAGGNLALEAQTQGEWFFDDVAINDSTGTAQTGLPGAGGLRHQHPAAAGDAAATAGTFASIDEVPPNDATDFIEVDTAIAADYAPESWASAGGAADDSITLVQVGTRQRCESGLPAAWTVHIKSQSGGTATTGASVTQDDTIFQTNGDVIPRNYPVTAYVDPQGSGAWTPALLDTAIFGVTVTDADPDVHFTALWMLVEFVPAAPPADQHDPFVTIQFRAA